MDKYPELIEGAYPDSNEVDQWHPIPVCDRVEALMKI